MAISWPARIADKGGIRWQFHHVIDIVPTILEVTGIPAPVMVDGIAQKPIDGVSLAYAFDKANADAPSPHKIQYFEMAGVQGLYNDGWMLSAVPVRPPWELLGKAILDPASAYKFELYDVRHDWTQYTDVAAGDEETHHAGEIARPAWRRYSGQTGFVTQAQRGTGRRRHRRRGALLELHHHLRNADIVQDVIQISHGSLHPQEAPFEGPRSFKTSRRRSVSAGRISSKMKSDELPRAYR